MVSTWSQSESRCRLRRVLLLVTLLATFDAKSAWATVTPNVTSLSVIGRQAETSFAYLRVRNDGAGLVHLRLVNQGWVVRENDALVPSRRETPRPSSSP